MLLKGALTAILILAVFVAALSLPAQAPAIIEGKVEIPPLRNRRPLPRYPSQTVQPGPPEPRKAAVYLEGVFPGEPGGRFIRLAQKELQFDPGLLVIRRGTTVEFPNFDDLYHNIFSYSKAKRFDLGRYRKDEQPATQTFDRAGIIRLNCEIHEHMEGTILVVDTPYFQKTESDGSYRLEGLPAGKFILKAWLSEKQFYERLVDLAPGTRLRVDFPSK